MAGLATGVQNRVNLHMVRMALIGVIGGASLATLPDPAVSLPAVGALPGFLVGGVGLVGSLLAYRRYATCSGCGAHLGLVGGCDCDEDCEDRD